MVHLFDCQVINSEIKMSHLIAAFSDMSHPLLSPRSHEERALLFISGSLFCRFQRIQTKRERVRALLSPPQIEIKLFTKFGLLIPLSPNIPDTRLSTQFLGSLTQFHLTGY